MKNDSRFERIKVGAEGQCLRVVLARPDVRNAFDVKTMEELTTVFSEVGRTGPYKESRAVLLSGEGKSFCAGADLEYMKSMAGYSREQNRQDGERLFAMFDAVRTCEVPVIAHVHGHAMGGALGITACADIAMAETGTQFRFSEVRLGIVPAVISTFVLSKMDPNWARRWMMTGELFFADQAKAAGLVHFVGTAEEVVREKELVVKAILEAAPEAVKKTKKLLGAIGFARPDQVRDQVIDVIVDVRSSQEGQEGLGSFLEKREPSWRAHAVKG